MGFRLTINGKDDYGKCYGYNVGVHYLKIPDRYEVDLSWIFHGTMFKMFKEEIQPVNVQLRLLS